MRPIDLSPRDVGRVLDDALALYGANFRELVKLLALIIFPVALVYGVTQVFYYRGFIDTITRTILSPNQSQPPDLAMVVIYSLSYLFSLVYLGARTLSDGSVYRSLPTMITGEKPTWRAMLRRGASAFPALLGIQLIIMGASTVAGVGIAITLGLGVIALIAAAVFVSMTQPVVAMEGARVVDSFGRSYRLVRGRFWAVAGLLIAIWFVSLQIESAIVSPIIIREVVMQLQQPDAVFHPVSVGWKVVEGVLQAAAVTLVLPFSELALGCGYLDLRSRREGMDLLMRAQRLAPATDPGVAGEA